MNTRTLRTAARRPRSGTLALALLTLLGPVGAGCSSSTDPVTPEPEEALHPPSLFASALAYDGARGGLVVFGGQDGGGRNHAATWLWREGTWTSGPTAGPAARYWSAMASDPGRGRLVLFGGAGAAPLGDTWTFDGSSWSAQAGGGPPARYAHEMVWDARRGEVLLFGGRNEQAALGDLWAWDGTRWVERATPGAPPARAAFGMTFDAARGELVVFGGFTPGSGSSFAQHADTWVWDGQGWSSRGGAAEGPGPRDHVAMAYDAARQRVVLFGGVHFDGSAPRPRRDTWEWDGQAWHLKNSEGPSVQGGHRIVWDERAGRVILWTGSTEPGSAATTLWAWDGTRWSEVG